MLTIDAQVHSYERNHPGRPWHATLAGPPEVTGDQMVAHLDAAGVDGAILVSAFTMYRYDASYAVEVRNRHPGRFALVKPVDPANPAVEEVIADWKRTPGTVGVRMLLARSGLPTDAADPGLNRVLATAARHSLPANLHIAGRLDQGIDLIRRHPDTQIIVDHLCLVQPHEPPVPAEPWAELPKVLTLAALQERRHQDHRRLHAVARALSLQRHLGPGVPRDRRVRHRPLPVGHGLDARHQLPHARSRASTPSAPPNRISRERQGEADGCEYGALLRLVAEEDLRRTAEPVRPSEHSVEPPVEAGGKEHGRPERQEDPAADGRGESARRSAARLGSCPSASPHELSIELETADAIDDGEVAVAAFVARILDGGLARAKQAGAAAGGLADHPVARASASRAGSKAPPRSASRRESRGRRRGAGT